MPSPRSQSCAQVQPHAEDMWDFSQPGSQDQDGLTHWRHGLTFVRHDEDRAQTWVILIHPSPSLCCFVTFQSYHVALLCLFRDEMEEIGHRLSSDTTHLYAWKI